jgi:asparagine synthase (glutamine-hydrolysing)
MSVIFGLRRPCGQLAQGEEMRNLAETTKRYAPDGTFTDVGGRVGMGFQPFHTTERSRLETQPLIDFQNNMLVLDGRLDNYRELREALNIDNSDIADSGLILAAFRKWGETCFSRFVGDWALAIWSARDHTLYLARDHAGTRTLFFQEVNGDFRWSTYLETFFTPGSTGAIDAEYVARFVTALPIRDLTPYKGIHAVPPAHYLIVQENKITRRAHWNWMADSTIRYSSATQYDDNFLDLLKTAVQRRTAPGDPALAHLSGGMDSTSVVRVSDLIRQSQSPGAELIDTLSFYDDSEPNWNEKPYFSLVEARRGKAGIHVNAAAVDQSFEPADRAECTYLFPGADSHSISQERHFEKLISEHGYRVIVAGTGGDEVLGGVPTPLPELANYLVSGDLRRLIPRAIQWCLAKRTPLVHMLLETASFTLGLYRTPHSNKQTIPPWVPAQFRKAALDFDRKDFSRCRRLGIRPSTVANGLAWWSVQETLPHRFPTFLTRREYRYPYLDRDLVDFLFRVPREQLVAPGRRRLLMRRALTGIVPVEILERRRKAYLARSPIVFFQSSRDRIEALFARSVAVECGFVELSQVRAALASIVDRADLTWCSSLMRTIALELWIRANMVGSAAIGSAYPKRKAPSEVEKLLATPVAF